MEDNYQIKEIKIMDGVYIWKPEQKKENNFQNTNNSNPSSTDNINEKGKSTSIGEYNYLCHGKDDLVKLYEIEFEEIGNRIQLLFQSNEDMLEFDPNDYDLIQAREENLQLIDKKLEEIIKIQKKMKEVCGYHPIVNVDIFDYFGIGKKKQNDNNDKKDKKENKEINKIQGEVNQIGENINSINISEQNDGNNSHNSKNKNETKNNNDIMTEIEL